MNLQERFALMDLCSKLAQTAELLLRHRNLSNNSRPCDCQSSWDEAKAAEAGPPAEFSSEGFAKEKQAKTPIIPCKTVSCQGAPEMQLQ